MSIAREVKITTENKNLLDNEGKPRTIEVNIEVEVPESIHEAAEFFGGEEKLLESVQSDIARRKANTARPVLRDATKELDWENVAKVSAESYTPGRRAAPQSIDASEIEAASGDTDSLIELLRSKGYAINLGG